MKKLLIGLIIGIAISFVPKAYADWQRLTATGDAISLDGSKVYVVYDKLEGVNCYVQVSDQIALNQNRSNSIFCMRVK